MADLLQDILRQARQDARRAALYSIEPHGGGYALYCGRSSIQHGCNLAHITEASPATLRLIAEALNAGARALQAPGPAANERALVQAVTDDMAEAFMEAVSHAGGAKAASGLSRETCRAGLEAALQARSPKQPPEVSAWCWTIKGSHKAPGVSTGEAFLAYKGAGPDPDIEMLAASAEIPRRVQRFVSLESLQES